MQVPIIAGPGGFKLGGMFRMRHFRPRKSGKLHLLDEQFYENLVVDEGVTDILDVYFSDGTQKATLYLGLKGSGAVAAGDTAAQIGGTNAWSELTNYDEGSRPSWAEAGVSAKALTNSASPGSFTASGSFTAVGSFLISDSTKGGTTGVLVCAGDFAASRALNAADVIEVTYQISGDDDGV